MLLFIKPVPIIITFATMFGVLVHDMSIDKVARVATVPPSAWVAAATGAMAMSALLAKSDHVHVERASVGAHHNSTLPKVHPPRDDDREYNNKNKKQGAAGGDDHTYIWPSV